jgi:hypothetical protein
MVERNLFRAVVNPKLSIDSARHSVDFLPDFVLLIGAKMEPSKVAQICLPRFASIRQGFEFRIEVAISWLQSLNKLVSPIPNVVRRPAGVQQIRPGTGWRVAQISSD